MDHQSNGRAALAAAYEGHKSRLLTFAAAMLGDLGQAEDALHDVFASLASGSSRLPAADGTGAYLTAAVRNAAVTRLRARRRLEPSQEPPVSAGGADPAAAAASGEQARLLIALVARLPQAEREVVALRMWGGMTFREVAAAQGTSESTAHARYHDALEKLRLALCKGAGHE